MSIIILLITLCAFIAFFWAIGLWYLGLLPILFFLVIFGYYTTSFDLKWSGYKMLSKYSIFLAWLVMLIGIGGIFHFFDISWLQIGLWLIIINIILRFLSYIIEYQDGKSIFQLWYYASAIYLFVISFMQWGLENLLSTISLFWIFQMGLISFIVFIIWLFKPVEEYLKYKLIILTLWTLGIILYKKIPEPASFLIVSGLGLTIVYFIIYQILQKKVISNQEQKNISVRRILAWERVIKHNSDYQTQLEKDILKFINNTPKFTKYLLELANIVIIGMLIWLYIKDINTHEVSQLIYWLIILVYISNVVILKKINYTSLLQRSVLFLVINFAIYITLFNAFAEIWDIVWWAIVWNIFSSSLLFYAHNTFAQNILYKKDYIFWIITTIIALAVNIVLLTKLFIPIQLLISIIFLYLGIQGMILFYGFRYINRLD